MILQCLSRVQRGIHQPARAGHFIAGNYQLNMPDFLLDIRPPERRPPADGSSVLRWSRRIGVRVFDLPAFRLTVTWTEPDTLWAPWVHSDGSICAAPGFVAMDEAEWTATEQDSGAEGYGGRAARALWCRYQASGAEGLDELSGNCVVILFDAAAGMLWLRTDPAGCFPAYGCQIDGYWVFGSHPDVLASLAGRSHRLDEISLTDFACASTVTPPWTFYQGIEALEPGTVWAINLCTGVVRRRCYFPLTFQSEGLDLEELADALVAAWKQAVRRRTFPFLGLPAVALSGGLDSRLILACMAEPGRALAFTCYDKPNRELRTAEAIAKAAGAEFIPLRRPPDYYGENAPAGVRISGGMGTFANNHFLGVLEQLQEAGTQLLLTGCYCDYLFKALPLNRRVRWWDGREFLAPFQHEFYFTRWHFDTPWARLARERWESRVPAALRQRQDDEALYHIEVLRTFPLCYEGDNQQRLVPQRLLGWSPPVTDLEVLRVYRKTPSRVKLNRQLFLELARRLTAGSPMALVPDANTGASLDALPWKQGLSRRWLQVQRRIGNWRGSLASNGSWPNWKYYYQQSPALERLWSTREPTVDEFLCRALGWPRLPIRPADFPEKQRFLFVALLTLKLWWQYRPCFIASSN